MAGEDCLILSRRRVVAALAATVACPVLAKRGSPTGSLSTALATLERKSRGRLGVAVLDTGNGPGSGRITGHRLDERFGMCSTFKLPLAAVVLREIDTGRLNGQAMLGFTQAGLAPNSPVARADLGRGGMTILECAKAVQQFSDNTAANLLIRELGGPAAFTARLRALGDTVSRLDHEEPLMNIVLPGAVNDTTTPRGMAMGMHSYLLGGRLNPATRAMLVGWMIDTTTGARRLRAGFPVGWRAGDKTGSAWNEIQMVDKINDVAIVWPPRRAPVIVTAYLDSAGMSKSIRPDDEAILAEVGRIVAGVFA